MQPRNLISSKLLNLLKNNVEFPRHTVFLCAKFVKWEIWYAVKLLPTKYSFSQTKQVILDIIFLVIDIAVWLREIKKYFTCYVFLRQQIIFTTKITAANEATTDLEKLQVCRSENELANSYRNLERRTFHVRQINLSGSTFCFQKTICMTTCWNEQTFIKQNFETMRQHTLNN